MNKSTTSDHAGIMVTERNRRKLEELVASLAGQSSEDRPDGSLDVLTEKLALAETVGSGSIPRNCVTMGSMVSIVDARTSEKLKFTLVYPDDADFDKGRISILSPLGASIFGHQVGDEPEWGERDEIGHFVIVKVDSQPEAESTYTI